MITFNGYTLTPQAVVIIVNSITFFTIGIVTGIIWTTWNNPIKHSAYEIFYPSETDVIEKMLKDIEREQE